MDSIISLCLDIHILMNLGGRYKGHVEDMKTCLGHFNG